MNDRNPIDDYYAFRFSLTDPCPDGPYVVLYAFALIFGSVLLSLVPFIWPVTVGVFWTTVVLFFLPLRYHAVIWAIGAGVLALPILAAASIVRVFSGH